MLYLVISDTHGDISRASWIIEQFKDQIHGVLHLGDLVSDFNKLKNKYQDKYSLAFAGVCGNCDFISSEPDQRLFSVEGCKVLMVHGHKHAVKYGPEYLRSAAREKGANIVLYGHSHIPYLEEQNGLLILNPGSLSEPRGGSRAGFALLEIKDGNAAAILNRYEDFA